MRSSVLSGPLQSTAVAEMDQRPPSTSEQRLGQEEQEQRVARVERLVERHLVAVWCTARELGVASRDLDDVVQEVLVVCVRRLDDIDPGRERAFLLATTSRVVANWRRTQRRRPTEPLDAHEIGTEWKDPSARNPAEALERKRELELVQAALNEMDEQQRTVFTLFELEELTAREIAEQLGLTESVVFARVQRARAVFQRCFSRAQTSAGPLSGKQAEPAASQQRTPADDPRRRRG
jgi:RNA polymerase sigma-70 factor (ECF subfamily)